MVPHLGAGAGTGIDVSVFASLPLEERDLILVLFFGRIHTSSQPF